MRGGKTKGGASGKDDTMVSRKRKASDNDGTKMKRAKAGKDPNKPKRPPRRKFRKEFQEKHPDYKKVSVVSKACGDKWKSMSEAEKAPYVAKAAKIKVQYEMNIASYNKNSKVLMEMWRKKALINRNPKLIMKIETEEKTRVNRNTLNW